MSYCTHSFFFLQDYLPPDMGDLKDTISQYAVDHPIKFTAFLTFIILAGIPTATFFSYSVVTLIISLVGAILVEFFLLLIGLSALVFVLVFVSCATVCVTAAVSAIYYSLLAVSSVGWGKLSSFKVSRTGVSEPDEGGSFDKSKLREPLEIGRISQNFVSSSLAPHSYDFLRTALTTLLLVPAIFVMSLCVLFVATFVISFT